MISNIDLTLSGLVTAGTRLLTTASNLARANTSTADAATAASESAANRADERASRADSVEIRSEAPRDDAPEPKVRAQPQPRRRERPDVTLSTGNDAPGASVSIAREMTNQSRQRLAYRANAALAHADMEAVGRRLDMFDTTTQSLWSTQATLSSNSASS